MDTAGPLFDAIFEHVDDPPATPVADDPPEVIKWLRHHAREPLDTYFAYEDASVRGDQGVRSRCGLHRHHAAEPPAHVHVHQVPSAGLCLEACGEIHPRGQRTEASNSLGTLHFSHWVPFEHNHLGFFTIFDGDFEKYIQDFAEKTSFVFDAVFPHVEGAPPTPVAKNAQAFHEWALVANHPPIGFYSAYPGLGVQEVRALLADARESPSASTG